jgi:hypothetical protein
MSNCAIVSDSANFELNFAAITAEFTLVVPPVPLVTGTVNDCVVVMYEFVMVLPPNLSTPTLGLDAFATWFARTIGSALWKL